MEAVPLLGSVPSTDWTRFLSVFHYNTDCTGGLVEAADKRHWCVGTDYGHSYNNGTTCTLCMGISVIALLAVLMLNERLDNIQCMGSFRVTITWKRVMELTPRSNFM